MKGPVLAVALVSAAVLIGCGVGDGGRWLVDTSLRSAYGCSLLVSSDQTAASGGEIAERPEPLFVKDPAVVASRPSVERRSSARPIAISPAREPRIEIAALPISRDLSSIRALAAGTRSSRSVVRVAAFPRAARLRVHVARPEPPPPPPFQVTVCPGSKG